MDDRKRQLQTNLWKISAMYMVGASMFMLPIIVLFWKENGLSFRQILLIQSISTLFHVALEIPTGVIADRWGRKNATIIGWAFAFTGILVQMMSGSFTGFLCGDLILAIGISLHSGTFEALTFDTLLELGKPPAFRRIAGHQQFLRFSAEAAAGIIGGLIALVSLRATVVATLIPYGIGFIIALTLTEPTRSTEMSEHHGRAMLGIVRNVILKQAALQGIIVIHSFTASAALLLYWFTQPYLQEIGLPLVFFGMTHAVIVLIGGLAAKYTHSLERWIDDRIFLIAIAATVVASYLGLSFVSSLGGLVFFLTARIAWGFLVPLTGDLINRMTDSSVRATVLSLRAFAYRLLFAIASPIVGYFVDIFSLQEAMLIMGITVGIALAVTFLLMRPVWREIPK